MLDGRLYVTYTDNMNTATATQTTTEIETLARQMAALLMTLPSGAEKAAAMRALHRMVQAAGEAVATG